MTTATVSAWARAALSAVGIGAQPVPAAAPQTMDRGTLLAEQRTDLALDRTLLAAERTLMAWIRTSLSMISFGFSIAKILEAFQRSQGIVVSGPMGKSLSPAALGLTLIAIGTFALLVAVVQHRATLSRLHQRGLEPRWSLTLTVAGLMAVLGVVAFVGTVMKY